MTLICISCNFYQYLGGLFGQHSHIGGFLAGSGAGVTAVTFTYPLDAIRARLAFQVTGEHIYSGITDTAVKMFQKVKTHYLNNYFGNLSLRLDLPKIIYILLSVAIYNLQY